jgi:hypothetical protein
MEADPEFVDYLEVREKKRAIVKHIILLELAHSYPLVGHNAYVKCRHCRCSVRAVTRWRKKVKYDIELTVLSDLT